MEILQFLLFLLAMTDVMGAMKSYTISPSGTIWLGESITLTTDEIDSIKRPVVWESNGAKYKCVATCSSDSKYKVTQIGNVSTLWIKNITWLNSDWKFSDDNYNFGEIHMKKLINVEPKIKIDKISNCDYKLKAECSLPHTTINCFIGKTYLAITSNTTKQCPDGKTFTKQALLRLPYINGIVDCHFDIDSIFSAIKAIQIKCDPEAKSMDTDDEASGSYMIRGCINLVIVIIIAVIMYMY